jgi:hypothetical protein
MAFFDRVRQPIGGLNAFDSTSVTWCAHSHRDFDRTFEPLAKGLFTIWTMRDLLSGTLGEPLILSPTETAQNRAEIKRLEKARDEYSDGGIRKRIEAWIDDEKKKLSATLN